MDQEGRTQDDAFGLQRIASHSRIPLPTDRYPYDSFVRLITLFELFFTIQWLVTVTVSFTDSLVVF
jgi:hypothetical protein